MKVRRLVAVPDGVGMARTFSVAAFIAGTRPGCALTANGPQGDFALPVGEPNLQHRRVPPFIAQSGSCRSGRRPCLSMRGS